MGAKMCEKYSPPLAICTPLVWQMMTDHGPNMSSPMNVGGRENQCLGSQLHPLFSGFASEFVACDSIMKDSLDQPSYSCDPVPRVTDSTFCKCSALMHYLLMVMFHQQLCNMTATWNDNRMFLFALEICVTELPSNSQDSVITQGTRLL